MQNIRENLNDDIEIPIFIDTDGTQKPKPSCIDCIRIIRFFIRGDKFPLEEVFKRIWISDLGAERFEVLLQELIINGWIEISRFSGRGVKKGKKVVYLTDRNYSVHYLKYCWDLGIDDAYIGHHKQARANGSLFRQR